MKKNSIFKAIIVTFLIYVALSWILPGGSFSSGVFTKADLSPVGIFDLFIFPISTLATSIFVVLGLVILLIGALYGVMNRTGAYQSLVEGIKEKFVGKEKTFLIISIIVFALLASLTGFALPLFILVPLFVAVILSLGFNKMTAMLSTVGAILVGNMATLFGFNEGGYSYLNYFFQMKTTDNLVFKAILFVVLTALLIVYVVRTSNVEVATKTKKSSKKKEETKKEEVVIPLYKKDVQTKKSSVALAVILVVVTVLSLVALFNWAGALSTEKTIFDTLHTNIANVKIKGFPILTNLIGSNSPIGYWSNYELAMLLVVAIVVVGFVYNLKVNEVFEAATEGAKEMLAPALVAALAGILLLAVNSVEASFFPTIFNRLFALTKGLNPLTMSAISVIGSVAYTQFPYLCNALVDPVSAKYAKDIQECAFIMQAMFGFTMLVVPTSATLVFGLQFLGISYKEWLKENWKLLLSILVIALALSVIIVLV